MSKCRRNSIGLKSSFRSCAPHSRICSGARKRKKLTSARVDARKLDRYDFGTVLVALGAIDRLVAGPETALLPVAQRKNMGVIAMKAFGHGELKQRELALRYSLSLPGVSLAILGMDDEAQLRRKR